MKLAIYASHLNKIGGIETFVLNFCKRLKEHYEITFMFNTCDATLLNKISQQVKSSRVKPHYKVETDVLILATAWGQMPTMIKAPIQIQMIHADYVACIEGWEFEYKKLPTTTHHVAVSKHVAKQFNKATGLKADAVIYNLL